MRDYKELTSVEWSALVEYYKTHSAKETAAQFDVLYKAGFQAKLVQVSNKRGDRRKYTNIEIGQVVSLYSDGLSLKEIQDRLGMTYHQVFNLVQTRRQGKRRKHQAKIGERHNVARLSDDDVVEMLTAIENDWSAKEVAKNFGISANYVREIVRGKARTDNPKINEIRERILKAEKNAKAVKSSNKPLKTPKIHYSAFNNESGPPKVEL